MRISRCAVEVSKVITELTGPPFFTQSFSESVSFAHPNTVFHSGDIADTVLIQHMITFRVWSLGRSIVL